jgi:hypothetical protein
VGVECLHVCEGLDELKVVRGRRLAEQGERLNPVIVAAVVHECIKQRSGLPHELGVDLNDLALPKHTLRGAHDPGGEINASDAPDQKGDIRLGQAHSR